MANRQLLLLTLGILAIALPTTYQWYKHHLPATASAPQTRVEQLQVELDWNQAVAYYERYLQLKPDDTRVTDSVCHRTLSRHVLN